MRAIALAVLLAAGCYDPDAPFGVPCADNGDCPDGQSCDQLSNTCQPPTEVRTWRDDTAADFDQAGAVLSDAAIEPQGAIGPAAYLTGRFKLTGIAGEVFTDPDAATWDAIAAATVTGVGFERELDVNYGSSAPEGLGLADNNSTVAVEGELLLDGAGSWVFELDANDRAFLEIAAPGGDFKRVVTCANAIETGSFDVATPGWHRVRLAVSNAGGNMDFQVRMNPPNKPGGLLPINAESMRTRVDDLSGYVADGFAFGYLVDYHTAVLAPDPLDSDYDTDPYGIVLGTSAWSMRWSGQVLFDVTGDYVFHLESHRGHRMWIDGKVVADAFVNTDQQSTSASQHLEAGWHDVVVDLTKDGDDMPSHLLVRIESGPAWEGQTIPVDHVRPVMGRGVRWASDENGTDVPVPDAASANRTITVPLPSNAAPFAIEAGFEIDHPAQAQMSVVLDPPVGGNITLLAAGGATGMGARFAYSQVPAADAGADWTFIAADSTLDAVTGTLSMGAVTIHYAGGTAPFPTSYRYESAVRDLGEVTSLGTLRYQLRQTTEAKVQLRTCDAAPACASEPWTDVANDAMPTAPARRFAQYAVELATDGDHATALDWIELSYSVRKP